MNSLTANNRLSQQLASVVYERLPLRHECRLSNGLAVSNHREHYQTVGEDMCRSLTAGFVTREGFMFMSFGGNQKPNELSTCAKDTHMSVLALCGNSGVILLSVKHHQHIDSAIPGRYTVQAPYKAGAGIGVLKFAHAHNRASAVFLRTFPHIQIMVGRAGASKDAPGSCATGYANPVRLTTSVIGVPCGEFSKFAHEDVTMATTPTQTHPKIDVIHGKVVTSSLAVANFFSKRHDDVLKKIRTVDCSPEFCARNFAETSISVNQPNGGTRKLPCYYITRDGFAFLAMGFTGKRAARFKEAYINAFNQMEKQCSKASALSDAAHNASVLYSHLSVIHKVWLQQLYPMLAKVESPLAVSLYDRINDAAALASLINSSLNPSEVRGRK
jgi:Rha family phage regulatory protein